MIDEVAPALKKMRKDKASGLSGLIAEMIQAAADTGTEGYWTYVIVL